MTEQPVIIIGAGMAGSMTACFLSARGIPCTIIDRESLQSPRFRGEIIQSYGVYLMQNAGLLELLADEDTAMVDEFQIGFPLLSRNAITTVSAASGYNMPPFALTLRHHRLYALLRRNLHHLPNVNFVDGWRVERIHRRGNSWRLTINSVEGKRSKLASRILVGADGSRSLLHDLANFGVTRNPSKTLLTGLVIKCHKTCPDRFLMVAGRDWIAYAFPVGKDVVRLSMQFSWDFLKRHRAQLENHFIDYFSRLTRWSFYPLSIDRVLEPLQFVPCDDLVCEKAVVNGLLLAGDACGTVNPVTGHGLTLAGHDALRTASIIEKMLTGSGNIQREMAVSAYRKCVHNFSDELLRRLLINNSQKYYRETAHWFGIQQATPVPQLGSEEAESLFDTSRKLFRFYRRMSRVEMKSSEIVKKDKYALAGISYED